MVTTEAGGREYYRDSDGKFISKSEWESLQSKPRNESADRSDRELIDRISRLESLLRESIKQQQSATSDAKRRSDRQSKSADDAKQIAREIKQTLNAPPVQAVLVLTLMGTMATGMAIAGKLAYDGYQNLLRAIPGTQPGEVKDAPLGTPTGDLSSIKELNDTQRQNALAIVTTGQRMGMSQRDLIIGIATAMQESTLKNLDHGDDWWFQQNGWGQSDSRGLFQQRDSWGSVDCRMKPECAAELFFKALKQVSNRDSLTIAQAAQSVQKSAFPDHYAQWEELATRIVQAAAATADSGKTVQFTGIQVTSAKDASGEPGLDYVVSGGDRGAEFGALVPGTVIKTVMEDWESHLEAGDTRRGYGSYVIVRVQDNGEEIDMLYAHMDSIAVKEGDRVSVGTVIGTQGRKGSTTAPHVSVDFFAAGSMSASSASLKMRDRIAGILATDPGQLNAQIQQPPKTINAPVEIVSSGAPGTVDFAQSVVCVKAIDNGRDLGCASGAFVAPNQILTAFHVVQKSGGKVPVNYNGLTYDATIAKTDPSRDLALLNVSLSLPAIPVSSADQTVGQEVLAIGFPQSQGGKQVARTGNLTSVNAACGVPIGCLQVPTGILEPGMSGGVMLSNGQIVGVNRAIKEGSGIGVAVPAFEIRSFLAGM